jgi:hypothetical protein
VNYRPEIADMAFYKIMSNIQQGPAAFHGVTPKGLGQLQHRIEQTVPVTHV